MNPCFLNCQPFSVVLDALQDGVTIYDRDSTLIWVNRKACQIMGTPREELLGRNISEISTLPTVRAILAPELAGRSLTEIRQHYTRLKDYPSPGYMAFTNGKQMLYMATSVRDEHGALRYVIVTIRDVTDLNEARKKVDELQKLTSLYQAQLRTLHTQVLGRDIVYQGEVMRKALERTVRLARLDGNILLTGETGVGKTLLARYIHIMSRRIHGPFIHVNCASLPASLIEAELFGYSEGAFTGASRKGRKGLIEMGQGGTVFLDEIGDMPMEMQAKLLTVLEDKVVRRVGGEKWVTLDVRFLAATNKTPDSLLQGRVLREDLYYRLATNRVDLPPLRNRPEDIPGLIDHALAEFNEKNGMRLSFHSDLVRQLQALPWPGNVRELKNLVWQIASENEEEGGVITLQMLSADMREAIAGANGLSGLASHSVLPSPGHDAEEAQRWRALCQQYGGDVYAIADAEGVHRTTVIRKLKSYGLRYARQKAPRSSPAESDASAAAPVLSPPNGCPS
jgi:PAS domain S-box-containing protein